MSQSQCLVETKAFIAGVPAPLILTYISEEALPKGTLFRILLETRRLPFGFRSTSKSFLVFEKQEVPAEKTSSESELFFKLPKALSEGEPLSFRFETITPPTFTQRRYPIFLFVDPKGKGLFKEVEPQHFLVDVKPGSLAKVSVRTHALVVAKNQRFDIFVRYEDANGNPTHIAPSATKIKLSHNHSKKDSLSWQLFVSETGVTPIYQLYFNEPADYTYELENSETGAIFHSDPIKCLPSLSYNYYGGELAGMPQKQPAALSPEATFRYYRDELCHHFHSLAPFEGQIATTGDGEEQVIFENWKQIEASTATHNEEGRFGAFLGFHWQGENEKEGLRLMLYPKDHRPLLSSNDPKWNSLKKVYKAHSEGDLLSIPRLSMLPPFSYSFEDWDPAFERLVEIYSPLGSMEGLCGPKIDKTPCTLKGKAPQMVAEGAVLDALAKGCRFGFVAGGLLPKGPMDLFKEPMETFAPGFTVVLASEESRESFFAALMARRVYATSGARIHLDFRLADHAMGSELSAVERPGLKFVRSITGFVLAPSKIKRVSIIRNGAVAHSFTPDTHSIDIAFDDEESVLPHLFSNPKGGDFLYYYLRVELEDGHMAWSSPIWIDYPAAAKGSVQESSKAKKTAKKS